jgi:hypothetical protein
MFLHRTMCCKRRFQCTCAKRWQMHSHAIQTPRGNWCSVYANAWNGALCSCHCTHSRSSVMLVVFSIGVLLDVGTTDVCLVSCEYFCWCPIDDSVLISGGCLLCLFFVLCNSMCCVAPESVYNAA